MPRRPTTRLRVTSLEDRLTPAGGLDTSFGTGGMVTTAPGGYGSRSAVAAQPDGHLLVLSPSATGTSLTRYNADGSLDTTFGTNGVIAAPGGVKFVLPSFTVQTDGKIVLAGTATPVVPGTPTPWILTRTVVRLNADGSPDATFGTNGVVELGTVSPYQTDGVTVLAGGSIVLTGAAFPGGHPDFAHGESLTYTVLSSAGVAGATTTLVGPVSYAMGPSNQAVSATPTPDGGAMLLYTLSGFGPAGRLDTTVVLVKLTADGTADANFDGDGLWFEVLGNGNGQGVSLAVQPDGKALLTAISSTVNPNGVTFQDLTVLRLNADSTPDTSFGGDGEVTAIPGGGYSGYASVALLPDGRVVVGSGRYVTNDAGVAVLNADGTPDDYFADGSGVGGVIFGSTSGVSVVGLVVSGDRIVLLSQVYDVTSSMTRQSQLGLAVLTEGPTTLVPPKPVVTPPVDGEPVRETSRPPVETGTPVVVETARGEPARVPDAVAPPPRPLTLSPVVSVPGDLNGDGVADKVVTDGPRVSVVSGKDGGVLVAPFAPFEASYTGTLNAVFVDVDGGFGDGKSELVVSPGQGGGPVVAVYNADGTQRNRFWGIEDAGFRGGVNLAVSQFVANGLAVGALVVTAGAGGGPRVAVFDGSTLGAGAKRLMADFFAFEATQRGGAVVAFGDGTLVFAAGPGGGPRIRGVDSRSLFAAAGVRSLDDLPASARRFDKFVGDPAGRGGVTLTTAAVTKGNLPDGFELTADAGEGNREVVARYGQFIA